MNTNMKVFLIAFALLVVLCAGLFFVLRRQSLPSAKAGLTIGWMGPLTGDAAPYGQAIRNGTTLALDESGNKIPNKSEPLAVYFEDDQAQPRLGRTVFKALAARITVPLIIQAAGSSVMLANIPEAQARKIVYISPSCSSDKIKDGGDYIFRTWPSDSYQADFLAPLVYSRFGYKKAAILYINNEYGEGLASQFKHAFIKAGGTVVLSEPIQQSGTDFRAQLLRARDLQPDVIFTPVHALEGGRLLRQARELSMSQQFVADAVLYSPDFLKAAGSAAEGMLISNLAWHQDSASARLFSDSYKTKFGTAPDIYAAAGYDCTRVILESLRRARSYDAESLKSALYSIKNFEGVTGSITIDSKGEVRLPYELTKVKGEQFAPIALGTSSH